MSENGSWRNWAIIFVLLIVFAVITALWSSSTPDFNIFGGNRVDVPSVPVEVAPIEWQVPQLFGGQHLEFSPLVGIGVLTGIVIGFVLLVGAGIAFANTMLERQTTAVTTDPTYKEVQTEMAKREKDRVKQMQVNRKSDPIPDHNRPRWSAISTSLLILLFVGFFGMIVNFTFIPSGEYVRMIDNVPVVVNSAPYVVGGMLLATVAVLLVVFRPKRAVAAEQVEAEGGIPWDSIAVLITGLLIVGIGIGAMVYLGS